jgi:hypothetical protein
MLFQLFHEIHRGRTHDLPALLPEVELHWDPRTLKERGAREMLNLRMDFLMLLPGGHRIVLEVDGKHHYPPALKPTRLCTQRRRAGIANSNSPATTSSGSAPPN